MKRAKRLGAAMLLAGAMSAGMATTVSASARETMPLTDSGQDFCGGLTELIEFLESRPEGRLRDALLAYARRVFAAHCE